jgi:serine/threonine protein kinase
MTLAVGSRLGVYDIVDALGAGGMGEVYRARDTRLRREVAIKILPESVASDPDRRARFQREAELLAALNHPNIAAIYGVEESTGATAIVMELVAGETLAEIIARGAVPVDEALGMARQIAEALEAAHERGVIHRDLKPANIKLTPEGKVKVLDFGLAKALEGAAIERASGGLTMSPTLSVHATYAGVILGTAAYMSPEQARGKPVDCRADIWAFGCVVYEMLTGRQTFEAGETVSDAVALDPLTIDRWSAATSRVSTTRKISAALRHAIALRCLAGPAPEGSMKGCGLRVLEEEGDVGDAEAAILQQRSRELGAHRIEDRAERRPFLSEPPRERPAAHGKRPRHRVGRERGLTQILDEHPPDARAQRRGIDRQPV